MQNNPPKDPKNKDQGYLVVTRRIGDALYIGDKIRVSVSSIGYNNVKIVLEAPPKTKVKYGREF